MNQDLHRISWILLDVHALGSAAAARKWRVGRRTVERYRAQLEVDPELQKILRERRSAFDGDLATMRVRFLRRALRELTRRLKAMRVREIVGALKHVGEQHQVAEVLDGGSAGPDPEAAAPTDGGETCSDVH